MSASACPMDPSASTTYLVKISIVLHRSRNPTSIQIPFLPLLTRFVLNLDTLITWFSLVMISSFGALNFASYEVSCIQCYTVHNCLYSSTRNDI